MKNSVCITHLYYIGAVESRRQEFDRLVGRLFPATPSIGLNDKTLENNCVISNRKILPPHPHRPYETLRAIR